MIFLFSFEDGYHILLNIRGVLHTMQRGGVVGVKPDTAKYNTHLHVEVSRVQGYSRLREHYSVIESIFIYTIQG